MTLAGELAGLGRCEAAPNAARQVRRGMWWLRRCKAQSIKAGCNTCPTCSATSSVASPCSAASVVSVALQSQGQRQNRPLREPAQRRRWRAHAQALLLRDDPVRQCGQQGVDTLRPVVGVQVGNAVPLAPILGCRLGSGSASSAAAVGGRAAARARPKACGALGARIAACANCARSACAKGASAWASSPQPCNRINCSGRPWLGIHSIGRSMLVLWRLRQRRQPLARKSSPQVRHPQRFAWL